MAETLHPVFDEGETVGPEPMARAPTRDGMAVRAV